MAKQREPDFSIEDLIRELNVAAQNSTDGITMEELHQALGGKMSRSWVRAMLYKLIQEGKAEYVGCKESIRIDGVLCKKPVYRLAKKEG